MSRTQWALILLSHDYKISLQRIYDNRLIAVTTHDTF
nr:MAG TPA: hypothetical protein [Caudoviricetes sp.]